MFACTPPPRAKIAKGRRRSPHLTCHPPSYVCVADRRGLLEGEARRREGVTEWVAGAPACEWVAVLVASWGEAPLAFFVEVPEGAPDLVWVLVWDLEVVAVLVTSCVEEGVALPVLEGVADSECLLGVTLPVRERDSVLEALVVDDPVDVMLAVGGAVPLPV